jgi:hypothetical protein
MRGNAAPANFVLGSQGVSLSHIVLLAVHSSCVVS